jgi:hypothetical protein
LDIKAVACWVTKPQLLVTVLMMHWKNVGIKRADLHVWSLVLVINEPKSTFNCWKMFPWKQPKYLQTSITIAKNVRRTVDRNLQLAIMNKCRPEIQIIKRNLAILLLSFTLIFSTSNQSPPFNSSISVYNCSQISS